MSSNHKIKICHVVNRLEIGGMENGVINISNKLDRTKFQPLICCLKGLGPMSHRLKKDVRLINMRFKEGTGLFSFMKMMALFKSEKPDIVHTHGWGCGSFCSIVGARLAGVPIVINGEHGHFFLKPHQVFLQRILARLCHQTLAVSESLKSEAEQYLHVNQNRIMVIVNGVDEKKFHGTYDVRLLQRKLLADISKDKDQHFIIGCVGSLKPAKNQDMLLRALKEIADKKYIVVFIGNGPDRQKLEHNAAQYGISDQVLFLGERHELHELFCVMQVLVIASLKEGLSNVTLEAMASGLPVISTSVAGMTDVVRHGETGYLIALNDVTALKEKIMLLSHNPKLVKTLGTQGRQLISNEYSLKKMIAAYEKLYFDYVIKNGSRNQLTQR